MNLEFNEEERELLIELLESRTQELHPEIRRSMDHNYKDMLKHQLECYRALLERVKASDAGA